jgi:hypothetical protein
MLRGGVRNFWRRGRVEAIVVSMRLCAALLLSVALLWLAAVPGAHAATYCLDPAVAGVPECIAAGSPQQALDMAKARPGFDVVVLGAATYDLAGALSYSDGGSPDNGLRIESRMSCPDRYTCNSSTLRGGAAGGAALALNAAGGSDVRVNGVRIDPAPGVGGLVLGPGARAEEVNVRSGDAAGIRLEGTPSMPAVAARTSATGLPAVDVAGYGVLDNSTVTGAVGVRGRAGSTIDIRGGAINAFTAVVAPAARITGTGIAFAEPGLPGATGAPVGVEASCADAAPADASIEIVSTTITARNGAGATGVRARGRGGDGTGCDATVTVSNTIVHNADVSLAARGEAGTGADPREGSARIDVSYSNFRAAATSATGPATIETATPGHNLETDPAFAAPGLVVFPLLWTSPLIDAGSPAPPEEWQRPYVDVVHGRRDIGEYEYGFNRPVVEPYASYPNVATGKQVDLYARSRDADYGDPLDVVWTLPGGGTSSGDSIASSFDRTGRYRIQVQATDPTGQVTRGDVTVRVLKQVLTDLRVRPVRFRASPKRREWNRTWIRFWARAADTIDFRVHRAIRRRGSRIRWRRVPGKFEWPAYASEYVRGEKVMFNGWVGRTRLRPGLYRLSARGRGEGKPAATRFRILR